MVPVHEGVLYSSQTQDHCLTNAMQLHYGLMSDPSARGGKQTSEQQRGDTSFHPLSCHTP
jgi:hypothetical protein